VRQFEHLISDGKLFEYTAKKFSECRDHLWCSGCSASSGLKREEQKDLGVAAGAAPKNPVEEVTGETGGTINKGGEAAGRGDAGRALSPAPPVGSSQGHAGGTDN